MKTVIEMAREAGAAVGSPVLGAPEVIFPQCLDVQRFAELVRADERERIKQENQRCYVDRNIRARGNT